MSVFQAADLLIPRREALADWAVIACDQFTSEPEYWQEVRERVGAAPSAYHVTFPEAELGQDDDARIAAINAAMRAYLDSDLFRACPHSYVYVERTLLDGSVRRGVVGVIDLEAYDHSPKAATPIRATERTVVERIPPRVKIRKGAAMELSHVLLLCDDGEDTVLGGLTARRDSLPPLYDFPLMQGGGRIRGWLVRGADADALDRAVAAYQAAMEARYQALGIPPIFYAVGDGNHSLATAKACWEAKKAAEPALAGTEHPARYAMVELENIHDDSQRFEPIHRLITGTSPAALLADLSAVCAPEGYPVRYFSGGEAGEIRLNPALGQLPVGILQTFLDSWLESHPGKIDYIHGDDVAQRLGSREGAVSFLLPAIPKGDLFRGIAMDGVLPRKTFSMGHAREKRYYLEARRI